MGQITIYLDDDTEQIVRRHVKGLDVSTSKWIAEAVRQRVRNEWPADVASLFGSWKDDDFPDPRIPQQAQHMIEQGAASHLNQRLRAIGGQRHHPRALARRHHHRGFRL